MSIQIQKQIKDNASDIKSYINDLYNWEDEVNKSNKPKKEKKEY